MASPCFDLCQMLTLSYSAPTVKQHLAAIRPAVGEAGEVALIAPPLAALTSSEQIDPDRTKEKIASTIIAVRSYISPQIARVLLPPPIFTLWQHF